jgi:CRP/FNR family cyclic AMP-dependent transcriptional regulator
MTTRDLDLLGGVTPAHIQAISALGQTTRLATGDRLFRLGQAADSLFVIVRGRVALTLPMQVREHDEDILIEERGPGQTVGWSALIPPHRFTLTASALIETDVLALPREALLDYFAANPDAGYAVTRNIASVVGQRLQVFQAMWLREMQRVVKLSHA